MEKLMKRLDIDEFEVVLGGLILTASFASMAEMFIGVLR